MSHLLHRAVIVTGCISLASVATAIYVSLAAETIAAPEMNLPAVETSDQPALVIAGAYAASVLRDKEATAVHAYLNDFIRQSTSSLP